LLPEAPPSAFVLKIINARSDLDFWLATVSSVIFPWTIFGGGFQTRGKYVELRPEIMPFL